MCFFRRLYFLGLLTLGRGVIAIDQELPFLLPPPLLLLTFQASASPWPLIIKRIKARKVKFVSFLALRSPALDSGYLGSLKCHTNDIDLLQAQKLY